MYGPRFLPFLAAALVLWSGAPGPAVGVSPAEDPRALAAFVGSWQLELYADPATFGDRGGPGAGRMQCEWGLQRAWVDCELDSRYEGLGAYALKLVLYRTADPDVYGVFVTNSFGGGRLYEGSWQDDALVFHDAWVDPSRRWEHQRTTYEIRSDHEIAFRIEASVDGVEYLPHSSGVYRRAPR